MCNKIISIDPGRNTGWCVFDGGVYRGSGVVRSASKHWSQVSRDIGRAITMVCREYGLLEGPKTQLVIEMAQMFNTATSYASIRRGDLLNLIYLTGVICGTVQNKLACDPKLVTPMEWKGQLPKDVVITRLKDLIGNSEGEVTTHAARFQRWDSFDMLGRPQIRDHEADAIGLGLWYMGLFGKART